MTNAFNVPESTQTMFTSHCVSILGAHALSLGAFQLYASGLVGDSTSDDVKKLALFCSLPWAIGCFTTQYTSPFSDPAPGFLEMPWPLVFIQLGACAAGLLLD